MIDEARSWNEDSEFRKKIEEKRRLEEEEAKRLQEEKENARASKKKNNTSAPRNAGEDKNARAVSTGKSSGSKPEKVKKEKGRILFSFFSPIRFSLVITCLKCF